MASVTSPENLSKEVGGVVVDPDAEQTTPDSPPAPDQSDSLSPPPAPDQTTPTPQNDTPLPPVPEEGTANTPAPKSSPTTTPSNSPPPKGSSTRPSPESKNTGQDSKNSPNAVVDGPPVVSSRKSPSQQSSPSVGGRSSSSDSGGAEKTAFIVGAVVASVFVLLLLAICLCCCFRKKKRKHHYYMDSPPHGAQGHHQGPHQGHHQGHPQGPHQGEYYSGAPNWSGVQSSGQQMNQHMPPPNTGGWTSGSGEYHSGYSGQQHMPPHSGAAISPNVTFGSNKFNFTYEELAIATGGFSQGNLLGQGGFGYVHKGVFPDGKEVAVKSLKVGSGQGEREFQAEVEIISRVHHRHLVSLVGYCIADSQRMLVYEFVPNGTMEHHLHGKGQPVMDWGSRMRIALGSAKGLAYLHEDCHPRIIHRDIKAANILLDNNFEAMVADFGLAKLSTDNHTHVSTRVMGTFGYLAPEYASSGKLSEKSDVFSFGVMLLELITGKRPVDPTDKYMEDSLVDWARPLLTRALEEGIFDDLVDPRLENSFPPVEMTRMIGCAAASIRHSARRRPRMSQIVRALEGDSSLDDLKDGPKPGASPAGTTPAETSIYDTCAYNADIMKFRKMVMSQDDYASSQFSATTSEYGHNTSSSSGDSRDLSLSGNQAPNKM